jgi:cardiolipin synthase
MNSWKKEQIFHNGDLFFARLEHDVEAAKKTIELETYIFTPDLLGNRILSRLKSAAARGVRVRVLIDGFGNIGYAQNLVQELKSNQVEAKIYHPLPWKLNRRNHRKVCVIDQSIAFLGGMNINDCHLKHYSSVNTWRDTAARVVGRGTRRLVDAFEMTWDDSRIFKNRRKSKLKNLPGLKLIKLNNTHDRRKKYHKELIHRILKAKDRVWITTPYFVPEIALMRALRKVAQAQVDVKLLVPRKIDLWFMKWVNRAFYSLLLSSGVQIFEYLPSTLHAKVMIVDDWMTVGSSNRNTRSWLHDLEVDLVITHPRSKDSLTSQFLRDLSVSQTIKTADWNKHSWWRVCLEKLVVLIKYWI